METVETLCTIIYTDFKKGKNRNNKQGWQK
jgi:hypothetical protein